MSHHNPEIEFSDHDLEVIRNALFTQEKILTVQSRAGGNAAKMRLNELQGLLSRLRGQNETKSTPDSAAEPSWFWGIFSRRKLC